MPLILFLNLKGGVGKTTNAVAVTECLASQGRRVLLVDGDHQCMAGELLLGRAAMEHAEARHKTLHDLFALMLTDSYSPEAIPHYIAAGATRVTSLRKNLDCIPCSRRIDDFSTNMAKARRGFRSNEEFLLLFNKLRRGFMQWCNRQYEFTLIDSPPSLAMQVQFFLGCAEYYILPCVPDRLSVEGSMELVERLQLKNYTRIQCLGTLWTLFRKQVKKHIEMIKKVHAGDPSFSRMPRPFNTIIPNSSAITDAMDFDRDYPSFKVKYQTSAVQYEKLCQEIEARIAAGIEAGK